MKAAKRQAKRDKKNAMKTSDEAEKVIAGKMSSLSLQPLLVEETANSAVVTQQVPLRPANGYGFLPNSTYREAGNGVYRGGAVGGPWQGGGRAGGPVAANNSRPQGPVQPTVPINRERREFMGVCHLCQAVGHRASECPEVICYGCQRKGHTLSCPVPRPAVVKQVETCQVCGTRGATFQSCNRCAPIRESLKDGQVEVRKAKMESKRG